MRARVCMCMFVRALADVCVEHACGRARAFVTGLHVCGCANTFARVCRLVHPYVFVTLGWFHATRAMMVIALIGFCLVVILCFIYMFLHSISKNLVIYAFTGLSFASGRYHGRGPLHLFLWAHQLEIVSLSID